MRLIQKVNDITTLVVNPTGSVWMMTGGCTDIAPKPTEWNENGFPILKNGDCNYDVALGFFMPSENLFGLPGRESDFNLKTTEEGPPYRLFNRDLDPHAYDDI